MTAIISHAWCLAYLSRLATYDNGYIVQLVFTRSTLLVLYIEVEIQIIVHIRPQSQTLAT